MNQIECLREKLYKVLAEGNIDDILIVSRELDKLIFDYMEVNIGNCR